MRTVGGVATGLLAWILFPSPGEGPDLGASVERVCTMEPPARVRLEVVEEGAGEATIHVDIATDVELHGVNVLIDGAGVVEDGEGCPGHLCAGDKVCRTVKLRYDRRKGARAVVQLTGRSEAGEPVACAREIVFGGARAVTPVPVRSVKGPRGDAGGEYAVAGR